jgi:hypothetical protein
LEFFAFGVYENCLPNEVTDLLRAPLKILMHLKNVSNPEETPAAFLATLFAVLIHPITREEDFYVSLFYATNALKEDQKERLDSYVFSEVGSQLEHEAWLFFMHLEVMTSFLETRMYTLNAEDTQSVFNCIYYWYDKSILWTTSGLIKWRFCYR